MCRKGGYISLTSSPDEDYLAEGIAPFIACKNYDETISAIHTSKSYDLYGEQRVHQEIKNSQGTKRILLVDDEYDIILTVKLVLESCGFKVDSFTNPLLALDSFKTGLYDLAILDVKMPVMNGFGLYQEIRKLDDKLKICFLTAASEKTFEKAFEKEAFPSFDEDCIIRVPIENELLIKQIESILC